MKCSSTYTLKLLVLISLIPVSVCKPPPKNEQAPVTISHAPNRTDCFQHFCRCDAVMADCSGNLGRLKFIPKVPDHIGFVNFSHNSLLAINNGHFFDNVTQIYGLDLSNNGLRYLSNNAFDEITNLKQLFLDFNPDLTYEVLHPAFSVKTLQRLDARHGNLGDIPSDLFFKFPLPHLKVLYLHENNLQHLNMSALVPLKSLREFAAAGNYITEVTSDFLPTLVKINLDSNGIFQFLDTVGSNGSPFFPHMERLLLKNNNIRIHSLPNDTFLPKLQLLDLTGNAISHVSSNFLDGKKFPKLKSVFMGSMKTRIKGIEKFAFKNPMVEKLALMYDNVDFAKAVDYDALAGCPRLGNIQIGHNYLDKVTNAQFQRYFSPLKRTLRYLYMGNTWFNRVTQTTFSGFTALKKLVLNGNKITDLPDGTFDQLPKLQTLILSQNQIRTIQPTTFSPETRQRLRRLDLSGNPFSCNCDLLWFREWFVTNRSLFKHSWTTYNCHGGKPATEVRMFQMREQACLLAHDTYVFITVSLSVVVLTLVLASSLFRYRWHIRLVLYEAFRGNDRTARQLRLQNQAFQYDVFVSYAIEDSRWVLQRLMPELEGRIGLRLCVHERDFLPGNNIVDNIFESMQSSKKMLIVFSRNFARSQWCQFELALCLRHVMDYDDALLIVCLHDVASRDLTSTMMAVYKTTTYLQWDEDEDAQASFWGRLRLALQEIMVSPCEPCAQLM